MVELTEIPIHDRIDGLPQPFEHGVFKGHEESEAQFLKSLSNGRVHHAWLLSGPRGIGKATFAYRIARALLQQEDDLFPSSRHDLDNAANPDNRTFRQIAVGAHPNVLDLRIPYDEDRKRFKTQLTVDEIRKTVAFFSSTAGEGGWRIAIIDTADDLNISAANALLKILEEPPAKTIFFLLSEKTGRLLPTIRSRCQKLNFSGLGTQDIISVLNELDVGQSVSEAVLTQNSEVLQGSVRRAFLFTNEGNADVRNAFERVMATGDPDIREMHKLAEVVSARGEEDRYQFFRDFVEDYLSRKLSDGEGSVPLVTWAEVWEKVQNRLATAERFNLDRKHTVLGVLHDLTQH